MGRAMGRRPAPGSIVTRRGDRTPYPDPVVHDIIRQVQQEMGLEQHEFTEEEILHRLLFASVNEACKILEEGHRISRQRCRRDVAERFRLLRRYRGGLMFWADGIGVKAVYDQIARWHQRFGARWAPANLLRELAESNTPFREAKPGKPR